ncbi:MAG: amidohydrolase [Acidimicrobiales bacterium]|nr:amidohydrolase [Acidimicrobiales bacterium]
MTDEPTTGDEPGARDELVSVNDHIIEPPDVWQGHLPPRFYAGAPRVIDLPDSDGQAWLVEDRVYPIPSIATVAGQDKSTFRDPKPARFEWMRPGCYDPVARVQDMDRDGVTMQTCFPSFPKQAGTVFFRMKDRETALACIRAYNDFVLEEWCASAPERFVPLAIVPLWDVEEAAREASRTLEAGARGVSFLEDPAKEGLPSYHSRYWDPLLSVIEQADAALCLHFFSSPTRWTPAEDSPWATDLTLMYCTSMAAMVGLLFSPVLSTFPRLKVLLAEGGIGWLPFMLEKADFFWDRHGSYALGPSAGAPSRPSELFRGRIYGAFISHDTSGLRERAAIGINQITWQCDYPHADSTWPESRALLGDMLRDLDPPEQAAIMSKNARRLFGIDRYGV